MQTALSNLWSTRTRQPGLYTASAVGTHQTGSSCFGWLMSVDYCHWVGCCIQQGTAAFPIRQLHLNGQQMHNEARGRGNSCSGSDSQIYFLPENSLGNLLKQRLVPSAQKEKMFSTKILDPGPQQVCHCESWCNVPHISSQIFCNSLLSFNANHCILYVE